MGMTSSFSPGGGSRSKAAMSSLVPFEAKAQRRPERLPALLAQLGADVLDHAADLAVGGGELVAGSPPALHLNGLCAAAPFPRFAGTSPKGGRSGAAVVVRVRGLFDP